MRVVASLLLAAAFITAIVVMYRRGRKAAEVFDLPVDPIREAIDALEKIANGAGR